MSTQPKPRGGSTSELTKLKLLWRDSLAESARDYWQARFCSADTQAALRQELLAKLKINLTRDNQLTEFRHWLEEQAARERQAERMQENEAKIKALHPDWTLDQVREEVLRQAYFETLASGDFKLGLATRKSDLAERALNLDARKLALLEAKAAQADQTDKVLTDAELSPEQRAQRIKEIYGRA